MNITQKIIYVFFIGLISTTAYARQPNPFANGQNVLIFKPDPWSEISNSDDWKNYAKSIDNSIYISIDEQKTILENYPAPKHWDFQYLIEPEAFEEVILFLKLPIKVQQVLYDHYVLKNSTIPSSYFETMYSEEDYRIKEEKVRQLLQKLPFDPDYNSCPSTARSPKYKKELISLFSILYVVKRTNFISLHTDKAKLEEPYALAKPFEYFNTREIKNGRYPILVCSAALSTITTHYGNFLTDNPIEYTELENLYREVFLLIMKEELLVRSKYIFVPLSMIKEHAHQSGLADYILKESVKDDNQLMHQDLAIQYYGSYDQWMTEIFNFISAKYN